MYMLCAVYCRQMLLFTLYAMAPYEEQRALRRADMLR